MKVSTIQDKGFLNKPQFTRFSLQVDFETVDDLGFMIAALERTSGMLGYELYDACLDKAREMGYDPGVLAEDYLEWVED